MNEEQLKKAEKAIEDKNHIEYMMSTTGWQLLNDLIKKEIEWGFEKSVSIGFRDDVKERPEVYFEHYGYINGLRQMKYLVDKYLTNGDKAFKDIQRWESKKNQVS